MAGLLTAADAPLFMLAGNAKLTLVDTRTGGRFTYKIQAPKRQNPDRPVFFVKVLTGSDNESSYSYMGTIFGADNPAVFRTTRASKISDRAPSAVEFAFVFNGLATGASIEGHEIWHEGACGRCGRALTVPESIARGIGPECAAIMGLPATESGNGAQASEPEPEPEAVPVPPPSDPAREALIEGLVDRALAVHNRCAADGVDFDEVLARLRARLAAEVK